MGSAQVGTRPRSRSRAALVLVAWLGGLALLTWALVRTGAGVLAPPPAAPAAWAGWLETREPLVAVVALLRLVGVGLLAYLAAATLLGVVVRVFAAARSRVGVALVAAVDVVTPAVVRRLLEGVFGASLATALVASPSFAPAAFAQPPDSGVHQDVDLTGARDAPLVPKPRNLPGPLADVLDPASPAPDVANDAAELAPRRRGPDHVVVAGESFWSIASDALEASLGRRPLDTEVVPYWLRVIDRNRSRLADPDDPDLILPGQVFDLPPP